MKRTFFILFIACLYSGLIQSCKKGKPDDLSDMRHVKVANLYETISNDIFKTFLYSVEEINDSLYHPNDSSNLRNSDPCITFSLSSADTTIWPKILHIILTGNWPCIDGISRDGEITVEMPGHSFPLNSKFTVTYDNYTVANIHVSGYKKIYFTNADDHTFTDTTFMQSVSTDLATSWSSQHFIQWVLGISTHQNISDDLYIYNGKASCLPQAESDTGKISFEENIINALQFINYCYWIGSGKAEIIPSGMSIRTVTYSDSCVNHSKVEIDNAALLINF